jgi:thiamine pyrophosphate-dependent acetolactate synthase large subunit-like protein
MSSLTGAELLVDSLEASGVDTVFNIPGVGIYPFVDAVADSDLRFVSGLSETAVGLIAEGYGRATRRPAFLNVYHSSGTALAMVAMSVAWGDHTPLVFSTTTGSRRLAGRDQYAASPGDVTAVTDQYTKWSYTVEAVERIPDAVDRAVTIASTPPMGPVHLAFPMDIYLDTVDAAAVGAQPEPVEGRYPASPAGTATVEDRYGDGTVYDDATASEAGLRAAAAALAAADAPLIAAGGEVGQLYATDQLTRVAELVGAPVVTEWRSPTYLPMATDHPLYLGDVMEAVDAEGVDLFGDADAILSVGFEFTEARLSQYPFRVEGQQVIQVTSAAREVGKQVPADVALLGHPRPTLERLGDLLAERGVADRDRSDPEARVAEYAAAIDAAVEAKIDRLEVTDRPTPAEATLSQLRAVFGEDLLLVNYPVMAGPYVEGLAFEGPDDYYGISGKASAQGWAAPAAIGVQLAEPDRHVVAVNGDGGFMFTSPTAMYTAAYYDVPVTILVLNNRGWGGGTYDSILENDWDHAGLIGRFTDPPLAFDQLAAGVGLQYGRIDRVEEVESVLAAARDHEGPSLVEVPMAFRESF